MPRDEQSAARARPRAADHRVHRLRGVDPGRRIEAVQRRASGCRPSAARAALASQHGPSPSSERTSATHATSTVGAAAGRGAGVSDIELPPASCEMRRAAPMRRDAKSVQARQREPCRRPGEAERADRLPAWSRIGTAMPRTPPSELLVLDRVAARVREIEVRAQRGDGRQRRWRVLAQRETVEQAPLRRACPGTRRCTCRARSRGAAAARPPPKRFPATSPGASPATTTTWSSARTPSSIVSPVASACAREFVGRRDAQVEVGPHAMRELEQAQAQPIGPVVPLEAQQSFAHQRREDPVERRLGQAARMEQVRERRRMRGPGHEVDRRHRLFDGRDAGRGSDSGAAGIPGDSDVSIH